MSRIERKYQKDVDEMILQASKKRSKNNPTTRPKKSTFWKFFL